MPTKSTPQQSAHDARELLRLSRRPRQPASRARQPDALVRGIAVFFQARIREARCLSAWDRIEHTAIGVRLAAEVDSPLWRLADAVMEYARKVQRDWHVRRPKGRAA